MSRAGLVTLMIVGPLALGAVAILLLVAAFAKFFTKDDQKVASMAVDAAITVVVGGALIVALAYFAL